MSEGYGTYVLTFGRKIMPKKGDILTLGRLAGDIRDLQECVANGHNYKVIDYFRDYSPAEQSYFYCIVYVCTICKYKCRRDTYDKAQIKIIEDFLALKP